MSPQVHNFVTDLVEMAKATERLPYAEQELSEARQEITAKADTIQRLELKLMDRANEITNLHARIRDLEVSRDDAEFRFLEAEDRTNRALDFIKTTFGNAGSLIQALEPPKPEPVPVQEPVWSQPPTTGTPNVDSQVTPVQAQGQSEADPIVSTQTGSVSQTVCSTSAEPSADASGSTGPNQEGVSVQSDPIAHMTQPPQSENASFVETKDTAPISTSQPSSPGPYHGKLYIDVPGWVPLEDWLAGGGTEADYHYRR